MSEYVPNINWFFFKEGKEEKTPKEYVCTYNNNLNAYVARTLFGFRFFFFFFLKYVGVVFYALWHLLWAEYDRKKGWLL